MLHKKGKPFPPQSGGLTERQFAESITRALKAEFGNASNAASTIMGWTGASERSAKHWLSGAYAPSAPHLLLLARHSAHVRASMCALAGMPAMALGESLVELRAALTIAVQGIDAVMAHERQ